MPTRYPSLRLVSAVMATEEEKLALRKRRGYWVDRAPRLRKPVMNLDEIATRLGYSAASASTVSKWIDGKRPIPSDLLVPLAQLLGLPDRFLMRPPLTDEERLRRAIASAEAGEQMDWDEGEEGGPAAGAAPPGGPHRLSA